MTCPSIIPPYLLAQLAQSDNDLLADRARRSLRHDRALRTGGRFLPPFGSGPAGTRPAGPPTRAPEPPASPGLDRTISDAQHQTTTPGVTIRTEGQPAVADPAVNEAYDALGYTWHLYDEVYDRNSIDGKGMPLLATVHYSQSYDNAFWDGTQMVFGDGDGIVFERFTKSVDVIGHELTHGVTAHTAGLLYRGQSGALNESVSDVFGSLVKQHHLGQTAEQADWLIGAELLAPGVHGRALRDMHHPGTAYDDPRLGKDPQPADMDHYVDTTSDNGGVHINSGIPNRAFCLACLEVGGHAWETIGPVWYGVLTGADIEADCDFSTFAQLTVDAAASTYGDGSAEHTAVRGGWATVGVLEQDGGTTSSARRAAPAPGGPDREMARPDTEVVLRRTGGFAGITRERPFSLGDLPAHDTRNWQQLLAVPTLDEIAAEEGGHPDMFCYSVTCRQAGVEVTVNEPQLPEAIQALFERTLQG
ncbi:MAG: M4 family metallopeptidase [Intrasporangium sp.]|uniref:protealysin inhibitor emfourin n=1 Tax=Intrasporangium sp. TaxID=1925024 RepID=UPI0026496655|nr:protealysin inhibitor emfourin [Intrasporangium sp.]MDN5797211.1 M4 family metallopeptidase [Intrasporangium sp.]